MSTQALDNSIILVKPSDNLKDYINALPTISDMPKGIIDIRSRNKIESNRKPLSHKLVLDKSDLDYIKTLDSPKDLSQKFEHFEATDVTAKDKLLNLEDLHWLHSRVNLNNAKNDDKVYLHELFEGSEVVLPKNKKVQRNPELEKRCQKLKAQQDNNRYKAMTKNVDSVRKRHPEDTIAYQMKQINTQLIAIFQFIVTVLAGFAFGFIGVELIIGNLDFGFRLLLGIICALVIALAELYFLAKKLNEDLEYDCHSDNKTKSKTKVD